MMLRLEKTTKRLLSIRISKTYLAAVLYCMQGQVRELIDIYSLCCICQIYGDLLEVGRDVLQVGEREGWRQ